MCRWWLACCTSLTWSWSITRKTQAPARWLPAALRPATWWCMTYPGRNRRQWNGTRWTVLEIHSKISIFNIHIILHHIILYQIISYILLLTACNAAPPAKSKMADGVWKGVGPLGFWGLTSTFAKYVFDRSLL